MRDRHQKEVTLEQLLEDPFAYQKYATGSDWYLLHNSQAFDLGLETDASVEEAKELMAHMDK